MSRDTALICSCVLSDMQCHLCWAVNNGRASSCVVIVCAQALKICGPTVDTHVYPSHGVSGVYLVFPVAPIRCDIPDWSGPWISAEHMVPSSAQHAITALRMQIASMIRYDSIHFNGNRSYPAHPLAVSYQGVVPSRDQ